MDETGSGLYNALFSTDRYMPHGHCYLWQPELVWMHVIADLAVAIAYFSIPVTLIYLLRHYRAQIPFRWVFVMFAVFITFCGITHLASIVTLWKPYYYLEGILKVITAAVSIATAVMIYPLIPLLMDQFGHGKPEDE